MAYFMITVLSNYYMQPVYASVPRLLTLMVPA